MEKKVFDLWADGYDRDVDVTDDKGLYPFAGYKKLLNYVYNRVLQKKGAKVLDIGFGTGVLTAKLYDAGCLITGLDFSGRMIKIARSKMPSARLIEWDFAQGLPEELKGERFDFVTSTYALHHIDDGKKAELIGSLLPRLKRDGKILIGDVSFETRDDLIQCKNECGEYWDGEEFYFVAEEMVAALAKYECSYEKISHCAGVLIVENE